MTVTRFWRAGGIDYKEVVELKGVDLERCQGKASTAVMEQADRQLVLRSPV